jgi:hypothetical protein
MADFLAYIEKNPFSVFYSLKFREVTFDAEAIFLFIPGDR